MVDPTTSRRLTRGTLFAVLSLVIVLFAIAPGARLVSHIAAPDLMLCLAFAWVLRRPGEVPAPLIAVSFLLADFLLQRPPGLRTALVLMMTEFLRPRGQWLSEAPPMAEMGVIAAVIVGLFWAERTITVVAGAPTAGLGAYLIQAIVTVAAYPVVVGVLVYLLRVRRPEAGRREHEA